MSEEDAIWVAIITGQDFFLLPNEMNAKIIVIIIRGESQFRIDQKYLQGYPSPSFSMISCNTLPETRTL